jgi:hypothetical protein
MNVWAVYCNQRFAAIPVAGEAQWSCSGVTRSPVPRPLDSRRDGAGLELPRLTVREKIYLVGGCPLRLDVGHVHRKLQAVLPMVEVTEQRDREPRVVIASVTFSRGVAVTLVLLSHVLARSRNLVSMASTPGQLDNAANRSKDASMVSLVCPFSSSPPLLSFSCLCTRVFRHLSRSFQAGAEASRLGHGSCPSAPAR